MLLFYICVFYNCCVGSGVKNNICGLAITVRIVQILKKLSISYILNLDTSNLALKKDILSNKFVLLI